MSDLLYADMTYCSLCDRYFPGEEARAQHVQLSPNHPRCELCHRRFANKNSLRNHWVYSPRHHYCAVCERDFRTAAGLRVHVEYAAVHRDDSDDDSDDELDDVDDSAEGWEDEIGRTAFPEENERADDDISDIDDGYSVGDEYWDEDDETEFEENRDAYYGFASSASTSEDNSHLELPASEPKHALRVEHPLNKPCEASVLFNCPLCLEPPKESSATRCGHLFCTPCIIHALSGKKLCPVCRKPASPRQLRRIYLSAA
ncbi:hypothetical protein BKA93DRAFT_738757 [Sparassis latifolia]